MKLLIASDIHGSLDAAQKIIELFALYKADKLVLLGDLYYHGPRNPLPQSYNPMETAKLFNGYAKSIIAVRGNCDAEVDGMISDFKIYNQRTITVDGAKITFTHGHKFNDQNLPKNCGDALFFGHTHKTFLKKVNGVLVANIGSISLPKQPDAQTYAVVDDRTVTLFNAISGATIATDKI